MSGTMRSLMAARGGFRPVSLVIVLLASLVLTACGGDDDDDPTPVPSVVAPAETVTPPDAATALAATPMTGADAVASPGVGGTPDPVADTVGRLAEGIAAAWPETSYRRVQVGTATGAATPAAGSNPATTTDEVLYPGSVHRTVVDGAGATTAEFVLVDGRLYARGDLIPTLFAPGTAADAWVELSGPLLAPGTAGGNVLTQLQALFSPRYSDLSPEQRAREAVLAAETDVDGRACFVFQTAETTQTGERLEVAIALEPSGRLCSVTTTGGGLETVETFTFDVPVAIAAPETFATPAAGTPAAASPVATPAA